MTKTKYILIDYENIHKFSSADLSVLKEEEFMVKLFLGVHNKEIGVDLVDAMLPIGSRVELIRLKTAGTNALDFVIAFYIGKLWSQQPDSTFYIISKDADYNALIKNLKTSGVEVHRRTCIADITRVEPAATPSMDELVATATAALRKNPHRPATQKTLRNALNVKKLLSEEQLLELMGALSKSGLVQIVGNKVTYNLEAGL
jgi:hypothetical protein